MRILITGITGFVGGHLAELLAAEGGHSVVGACRSGSWPASLAHLRDVPLYAADLTDKAAVERVIRDIRPEWLVHLAGYANPGKSFADPDRCWADNLTATRVLYDALSRVGGTCRVLFASTGLVYGDPDGPGAVTEAATLKPASPYAASKAAADLLSYQVGRSSGLDVVRVRLFNQIGPRQPADYAVANFARQIAAAEAGSQAPVIRTGDLSAERDLTDVRDMVAACRLLLERGECGAVYNAGRGRTWKIADVLAALVAQARVPVAVESTPDPGRRADTAVTRADPSALRAATGWQPKFELEDTLVDVLAWWRANHSPSKAP